MKEIRNLRDMGQFGIDALTGEACGLGMRILCDYTRLGHRILEKALGISIATGEETVCNEHKEGGKVVGPFVARRRGVENWNSGSQSDPHIGSIMLPGFWWPEIAVFGCLETGCKVVWRRYEARGQDPAVIGLETDEEVAEYPEYIERYRELDQHWRSFAYRGTAGDRNRHEFTGRVL